MADNEAIFGWSASNAQANTSLGYEPGLFSAAVPGTASKFRGIGFPDGDGMVLAEVIKISNGATLTTGVKIDLVLVDDGDNAADLGKVVMFGATSKLLTSGTDNLDMTASAATEQTTTVTLSATKGVVVVGTITLTTANLDAPSVGNHIAIQLRRIGTNASDTCKNRVILLKATAYAY